ncbi:hemerythrin domain-containing protein [Sulfolobus tengchongensis]|uniref:Hemerythrin domain-containing protein n=1 Tax=Sulfolobus tengchongensis TaxID=207809 RepID=A0AAX4KYW4_9CREN
MSYNEFAKNFRDEHRRIRDTILELSLAINEGRINEARELLVRLDQLTGPHFRYEEEAMYPALVKFLGKKNVEKLFKEHDGAIETANTLKNLLSKDKLNNEEKEKAVDLTLGLLPHVTDCEGLTLFVEKMPDHQVKNILESREKAMKENLPLTKWSTTIRKRPQL